MWHIPIRYRNNVEDLVPPYILDELIALEQIRQFYRPSEKRWVTIGHDPMRSNLGVFSGPEKRRAICSRL